jgi:hypothetical protein
MLTIYVDGPDKMEVYVRKVKTVKDIADYEYLVFTNAEKIAEGKIKKHNRADGWKPLVKRIAEAEGDGCEDD